MYNTSGFRMSICSCFYVLLFANLILPSFGQLDKEDSTGDPPGHNQPFGSHTTPTGVTVLKEFPQPQVFFEEYLIKSRPFIVKSILNGSNFPAYAKWTDDFFRSELGTQEIDAEPAKKEIRTNPPETLTISRFLELYKSKELYMVHGVEQFQDAKARKMILDDIYLPRSLLCGGLQYLVESTPLLMSNHLLNNPSNNLSLHNHQFLNHPPSHHLPPDDIYLPRSLLCGGLQYLVESIPLLMSNHLLNKLSNYLSLHNHQFLNHPPYHYLPADDIYLPRSLLCGGQQYLVESIPLLMSNHLLNKLSNYLSLHNHQFLNHPPPYHYVPPDEIYLPQSLLYGGLQYLVESIPLLMSNHLTNNPSNNLSLHNHLFLNHPSSHHLPADDIYLPRSLLCGGLQYLVESLVMWFSSGGTKSVLHSDDYENFNCVLDGNKELVFVDKAYKDQIEEVGFHEDGSFSDIDVDKVDMRKYPRIQEVPVQKALLTKGDCLYIPYQWYHQVNSPGGRSLALNFWFLPLTYFNKTDCENKTFKQQTEPITKYATSHHVQLAWAKFAYEMRGGEITKERYDDISRNMMQELSHVKDALFNYLDKDGSSTLSQDELWKTDPEVVAKEFPAMLAIHLRDTAPQDQDLGETEHDEL